MPAAYCTRPELAIWGAPAAALADIDPENQDRAISSASTRIDGYLAARVLLPLVTWGDDIRRAAAILAAYDLIPVTRGRNPEEAGDRDPIYDRYKDTVAWLEQVRDGRVTTTAVGQPPNSARNVPVVISNASRGWQGGSGPFTGRSG